ncbi:MAG: hypothetical protein GY851_17445 [bacterium]|nr:hypothetical protein [bacterium]
MSRVLPRFAMVFTGLLCVLSVGCGGERSADAPVTADTPTPAKVLNELPTCRLGAGVPGGWSVKGNGYEWIADVEPGPLGPGALRLKMGDGGGVELMSPARVADAAHDAGVAIWARSEPAGSKIHLGVFDNTRSNALFEEDFTATAEWQLLRLEGSVPKVAYYISLSASGNGSMWLDGLWFGAIERGAWEPVKRPNSVVLTPEADWGVVVGDAPLRVRASVAGSTSPGSFLRMRLVNTLGASEDLPAVALDATGVWEDTIDVSCDAARPYGGMRVEAEVVNAEGQVCSATADTVLMRVREPVPGPLPESWFGVHVGLREPDLAVAEKLGYKWCRIHDADTGTKWGIAEREPGQWVWMDDRLDLARDHGFSVMGLLDGSPKWESGTDKEGYWEIYTAPKNIDNWRNYVRQVVGHYKGRIDTWEVWNEPWDMMRFFYRGTPQFYVELLKTAYEEAKATNPACTIVGIDTYPAAWDQAILSMGAYPYYDVLSFHRYDPSLHAGPNDQIAQVAARLSAEQAKYGDPKPLSFTEGGPDVAVFHGSFLSCTDTRLKGDWSRAADQYPRMFLSSIAAGVEQFIAYSIHNSHRHGQQSHMLTEPGPLLPPMHASVAALAHFVDGADYAGRLVPVHDMSAHVFEHAGDRPFAAGPSTVVALIADGHDPIDLQQPIPDGVACFDRWGNAVAAPTCASRGITYLVVAGDARDALRTYLHSPPPAKLATASTVDALLESVIQTLGENPETLWQLFSPRGSLATTVNDAPMTTTRQELADDPGRATAFGLPSNGTLVDHAFRISGRYAVGFFLTDAGGPRTATFTAIQDGPEGAWRLLTLTLLKDTSAETAPMQDALAVVGQWADALRTSKTAPLVDTVFSGPGCFVATTPNGEDFLFERGDYLITMLNTAMLWGPAAKSVLKPDKAFTGDGVVTFFGTWELASFAFGPGPYAFSATLIQEEGGWRVASLTALPVP